LAIPVLARVLHLNTYGLLAVQFLAGVLLFVCCARLAERTTGSRLAAAFVSLTVAGTYAGSAAFVEIRGLFDGVAITLLLLCMQTRRPALIAVALFAAAWTDERAIIASPLVLLFHLAEASGSRPPYRAFLQRPIAGALAGLMLHGITRIAYLTAYQIPHRFDGNGLEVLARQVNMIPMALWTAFEGGWFLVALGLAILFRKRKFVILSWLVAALGVLLAVSVAVVDISRTTAYALPALFVALIALAREEQPAIVESCSVIAFSLSALWPAYYAGGEKTIWWQYPFPLQLVRWILFPGGLD
jgi:hypothetical protein